MAARSRAKLIGLALSWAVAFLAASAWADEPWGNDPSHNMTRDVENVPFQLDDAHQRWNVDTGTKWQLPMPVVTGEWVISGAHAKAVQAESWKNSARGGATLTCRSLDDGALRWQMYIAKTGYGLATYGVCGTPVIKDGRVYVLAMNEVVCLDMNGLEDGNDGFQDELKLMTGKGYEPPEEGKPHTQLPDWAGDIIWRFNIKEHWPGYSVQDATSCAPVLIGDQLWVSTAHQLGSEARGWRGRKPDYAPHLIVLDIDNGHLIARDEMDVPIVFHGEWSSPSLVRVQGTPVVVFPDGYGVLHGFAVPRTAPDGAEPVILEQLWSFDCNPPEWRIRDGKRMPYTEDKRLFKKYPPGYPEDADVWFQHPDMSRKHFRQWGPCEVIAMPTVAGNRIYVGVGRDAYYNAPRPADEADKLSGKRYYGQGRFMCLELAEAHEPPRLVWEDSEVARTQCTASVVDGLVYVGDMRGFLHCLDADSGRAYWRQDLGYLVECASQMVADGKVYVSNAHNDLMVFTAGRAEPKLLFERRFRSWVATPYPLDGAIVISTQRQISVFETKDEE